jgi:hypothetical protein
VRCMVPRTHEHRCNSMLTSNAHAHEYIPTRNGVPSDALVSEAGLRVLCIDGVVPCSCAHRRGSRAVSVLCVLAGHGRARGGE